MDPIKVRYIQRRRDVSCTSLHRERLLSPSPPPREIVSAHITQSINLLLLVYAALQLVGLVIREFYTFLSLFLFFFLLFLVSRIVI